jgi:hypothetical protein
MDLKFNKSAEELKIQNHFKVAMFKIKENLEKGNRIIEFAFPIEIASEVRRLIDEELKAYSFNWMIMRKGENQNGKVVDFISQTIGNERHYKLNYFGD